ncbi:MAG: acyl-CoA dehydrogenase family protein [Deltaproteobacteria bacterium]|nr:acyl-CoA dehydrogenase family protein [Deltaproteobacteria bacterium]MCB9785120.1 acyl-CoA dehydrogenase family protein [Deltaproteobacteria bacterium]
MDLHFTAAEQAFRAEARAWLEAHVPKEPLPSGDTREGFARVRAFERELFEGGWAVVSWPREYGGREASLVEWLIFEEEYYRAGAPPRVSQNGIFLLAPTLFEFGTDEQKARILRPMAAAEVMWAQAWSEPNAGSDLASLKSVAVRAEGGWKLTGQKTWCTRGAFCDWIYGLFRTDPEARRHKGLTYFMIPLTAPGVTVRPVERLDGDEGFAEVFLEDVFVPDQDVLGEVNQGWSVAMATTSSERGLSLRSPGRFLATAERLIALWRERGDPTDQRLRDRVVRAWMDAEAYRLHTFQTVASLQAGRSIGPESSINKLFWSEMDVRTHETALSILGALAELDTGAPDAVDGGAWLRGYEFSLAGPIYAGTNEIQRSIVAQHVLGLPRDRG